MSTQSIRLLLRQSSRKHSGPVETNSNHCSGMPRHTQQWNWVTHRRGLEGAIINTHKVAEGGTGVCKGATDFCPTWPSGNTLEKSLAAPWDTPQKNLLNSKIWNKQRNGYGKKAQQSHFYGSRSLCVGCRNVYSPGERWPSRWWWWWRWSLWTALAKAVFPRLNQQKMILHKLW